ncbi:MAG TPA: RsmE family RNA methyltransferase, partial [Armatimonadota bacterium]|nr:RsmE family RNA methyltransferase [Armatimonadota bacterium]
RSLAAHVTPCPEQATVIIGPEGGFTDEEARHAREAGAIPVRLGPRILRAETAALAAATIVAAAAEG